MFVDVAKGTKNIKIIKIVKIHRVEYAHVGDNEAAIGTDMSN